jgi:hypothetical protein
MGRPPEKGVAPEERLKRVFEPLVARILDDLQRLPNMNRSEYGPPDPEKVEFVIETIERRFSEVKERLRSPDPRRLRSMFSFDDMGGRG